MKMKDISETMLLESVPIEERMTMLRNSSLEKLIKEHDNNTE